LLHALYGIRYPSHYTFDVFIGAMPNYKENGEPVKEFSKQNRYVTRAIIYTDRSYRDWKIIATVSGDWFAAARSLEEFLHELRCELGTFAGESNCIHLLISIRRLLGQS
jgi:hypothetical protein